MMLIIGLGNPGAKFKNTRHNVGFMAIDEFAEKNGFPGFACLPAGRSYIKNPLALVSEKNGILLVKPQTFMNESGKAVQKILSSIKDQISDIITIHDDIDLPVGKIKIVKERGSAGHKGVESIIQNIGNEGLIRFRIGIGSENKVEAMKIVLKKFSLKEQELVNKAIEKTAQALDLFIKEGLEQTMNEYNK